MAYDKSKVEFTELEHAMALRLDSLVEQLADGFQYEDLAALMQLAPLIDYIVAGGDRSLTTARLITLAAMLERDNGFL